MKVQEHIPLRDLTTLKIGGTARYFCSAATVEEFAEAVSFAREKKVPAVVLGGGSNVLIASGEINALVVKVEIKGVEWEEGKDILKFRHSDISTSQHIAPSQSPKVPKSQNDILVIAGAGESWDGLVEQAVKRGLWGIENLSGIPGTVGAAPIQNIGAYGTEIRDVLEWVEAFNTKTGRVRRISNRECFFGYRDSMFKTPNGKALVITRVALRLSKTGKPNLEYTDLKSRISNSQFLISDETGEKRNENGITSSDVRIAILEIRSRKFPDLKTCGTAGSFFKNPIIPKTQFDELKKKYPELPGFPMCDPNQRITSEYTELKKQYFGSFGLHSGHSDRVKVPLAWILDNICGLKGYTKGNVALFERQPIVLVSTGDASAEEVETFAKEVAAKVEKRTGIEIEWEVQHLQ